MPMKQKHLPEICVAFLDAKIYNTKQNGVFCVTIIELLSE